MTLILGFLLKKTIGFRVSKEQEVDGIDLAQHARVGVRLEGNLGGTGAGGASLKHKVAVSSDEEVKA